MILFKKMLKTYIKLLRDAAVFIKAVLIIKSSGSHFVIIPNLVCQIYSYTIIFGKFVILYEMICTQVKRKLFDVNL